MLKVGDVVKKRISCSDTSGTNGALDMERVVRTGKVIYVHPRGLFYTAEFNLPDGTIRESYRGGEEVDSEELPTAD
jgi:hypothetical protein